MTSSEPGPDGGPIGEVLIGTEDLERRVSERRRRVRVRLTPVGRAAFDGHVAALRAVVAMADSPTAAL